MKTLDDKEIAAVQTKINAMPNGTYEVSDIYGNKWKDLTNPHAYGKRFLQTVISGLLKRIRYRDRLLNNHRVYDIFR
jgi:hypothetical protein